MSWSAEKRLHICDRCREPIGGAQMFGNSGRRMERVMGRPNVSLVAHDFARTERPPEWQWCETCWPLLKAAMEQFNRGGES